MKKAYEIIVDQIINKLEQGTIPWKKSWKGGAPINYFNNREYRGINRLILSIDDFQTNYYLTYKQVKILGGNIKTGSKATKIIYWNIVEDKNEGENKSKEKGTKQFFTKYYNVFNIEQTDLVPDENIAEHLEQDDNYKLSKSILNRYKDKPQINIGPNPCYIPNSDTIEMPNKDKFSSSDEYYSTLFHELIHSTGSQLRLAREGVASKNYFGSHSYSTEELIAEIGSMFLSNYAGIENAVVDNQISYIDNWLKFIKGNKLSIIKAASESEKAVEYIMKKHGIK